MKVKLSAVIITYNEERNIGRCLDSVTDLADDVLVVDSFSTDGTEKICREKGARFVQHAFAGHIEQKNWAITQAKYPHVLSLDADEAVDDTLRQSILKAKDNWKKDGYMMNRRTYYCGKWIRWCGWYPDKKLRLWDSRKGQWVGVNPHDRCDLAEGSQVAHLDGDILHYSYYTVSDHIRQVNYFTDIAAQANYERGRRSNLLKMLINPMVKFGHSYIFKLGFLDGYYGFVISVISAHATYLKYVKLKQLQDEKGRALPIE